jgi:hypothetical protein
MQVKRIGSSWLGLLTGAVWAGVTLLAWGTPPSTPTSSTAADRARTAALVPVEVLPPHVQEGARLAVEKATLFSHGPAESFSCDPAVYYWFLDHPDRAVTAWRRLGAKCLSISDRGGGKFGWSDEHGSDIVWETVYRTPTLRVWYAEGKVRPAPLLPLAPVRALVLLHHTEGRARDGSPVIRHQADMFLRTDSAAVSLASKLMGPSAPRLAEQSLAQLQMFFAGLAWYVHRHPERADGLLAGQPGGEPAAPARPASAGPSGN